MQRKEADDETMSRAKLNVFDPGEQFCAKWPGKLTRDVKKSR